MTEPPIPENPGQLRWGSTPYDAFRLWVSVHRLMGSVLACGTGQYDLDYDDVALLFWIGEFDGVDPDDLRVKHLPNQHNLGVRSELSQSTISGRLAKLVDLGLVKGDRPSKGVSTNTILYSLTDAGRAELDAMFPPPVPPQPNAP